jgi:hypothetical protein
MRFKEWMKQTDEKQIDALYNKARLAVDLVKMYDPKLLDNISTIADLASGAYGLYSSGDNKKILPQETEKSILYWGKVNRHNLDTIPEKTLLQYYPQLKPNDITPSDTIRVNVRRILREFQSDFDRIIQIASTIVHEATHEMERETTGKTSETTAYAAERKFMDWVKANLKNIQARFPELANQQANPQVIQRHI